MVGLKLQPNYVYITIPPYSSGIYQRPPMYEFKLVTTTVIVLLTSSISVSLSGLSLAISSVLWSDMTLYYAKQDYIGTTMYNNIYKFDKYFDYTGNSI